MQSERLTPKSPTKKATILFPPDLFKALEALAKVQNTSMSELVRIAVRQQYALNTQARKLEIAERLKIIEEMKQADFPFWTWQEMEKDYEETFFG